MDLTNTADKTTGNSALAALTAMFYEPSKAFAMLQPKRHAWIPLALVMLASFILVQWYFSVVDFAWFVDQVTAKIQDPGVREKASQAMSKGFMQGSSLVSVLVVFPLITALMGLYFMLVAKFMSIEFSFGTGFALSTWSSLPSVLLLPLGVTQILMSSNHQLSMSELNPLSVNQLFFHFGMNSTLAGPLDMINVTGIWSVMLTVIGFQAWAKVSRATAVKVAVIPYVLIIAVWLGIALATSKAV